MPSRSTCRRAALCSASMSTTTQIFPLGSVLTWSDTHSMSKFLPKKTSERTRVSRTRPPAAAAANQFLSVVHSHTTECRVPPCRPSRAPATAHQPCGHRVRNIPLSPGVRSHIGGAAQQPRLNDDRHEGAGIEIALKRQRERVALPICVSLFPRSRTLSSHISATKRGASKNYAAIDWATVAQLKSVEFSEAPLFVVEIWPLKV